MHKEEQETIITWDAAHLIAELTTFQPKIWRHLEQKELPTKPEVILGRNKKIIGKSFHIPKNWIHIYKPRDFTGKQRKIVGNLLRKFRCSK